jgi:hypothetical protein
VGACGGDQARKLVAAGDHDQAGGGAGKQRPDLLGVAGVVQQDEYPPASQPRTVQRRLRAAYVAAHVGELDERGRRLVVRNGHAQPRQALTSAGAVEVVAPRVHDKRVDEVTGQRERFASVILPAWCRKSRRLPRCCRCCTCREDA